ncbi:signal peptidase I [candidate division WWE3 bacterium]|nr:signal peptidase I [candidate division WWE3 bacterium]
MPSATGEHHNFLLELVESFLSSFAILLALYIFLAFPEIVSGASMEPTLMDGDRILVERVSRHILGYKRGDIIIFHPPGDDDIDYVKRVVGIPGDIVKISDCGVYVVKDNSRYVLEEPYLYSNTCTQGGPGFKDGKAQKIEDGHILVMGDNRTRSADSRTFGVISDKRVVGKAVARFWPLQKLEIL